MKAEFTKKDKIWIVRDNEKVLLTLPIEDVTVKIIKAYINEKAEKLFKEKKPFSFLDKEFNKEEWEKSNPLEGGDEDEILKWFDIEFGTEDFGTYLLNHLEEIVKGEEEFNEGGDTDNEEVSKTTSFTSALFKQENKEESVLRW